MDAYDLQMDKYGAEQRFREEVQEEIRVLHEANMKSICKKECKLDETRQYCTGCFRTLEEITRCGTEKRKT